MAKENCQNGMEKEKRKKKKQKKKIEKREKKTHIQGTRSNIYTEKNDE